MAISTSNVRDTLKNAGSILANTTADLLANSDFINRSVGMANSYEDIMFIVQALGREPISLLGKDYLYIFDHVRRNYNMGTNVMDYNSNECPKFTFYKEKPTVRFANPYDDPKNLLDRWTPNVNFEDTMQRSNGDGITIHYSESDDERTNNKHISYRGDVDGGNPGTANGAIYSFGPALSTCDLLKKTNDNFNHGKYQTLMARFHTNIEESKSMTNPTQTANSKQFGMSHGRNLLKKDISEENGYENPYCRVWTYHHQYNQLARAIRPFEQETKEKLEEAETLSKYGTVGFRTKKNENYGFDGGSARLDQYGVLNYRNGMVNIAPTAKIKDYFENKEDDEKSISTKKCMFSIENLAWKSENIIHNEYDQFGLSPEQKGPLGGRIMWFPPYDLSFSEDVSVNWNANQFIGRGEKVYTYTDTERRGNLSFTLLIDHPAILDYWTGHARNGMENDGKKLSPGNSGGVDNKENQENTLLRFFAGCEILTAKPQKFRLRQRTPNKVEDVKPLVVEDPPETEVHNPTVKSKILYCFAFYPNNYSGMDDAPSNSAGKVNAIEYLLNGIGTQRVFNENTKKGVNFAVDMTKLPYGSYGGYEMQPSNGISIATKELSSVDAVNKTYEGATEYVQFLTDETGRNKYEVDITEGGINDDSHRAFLTKYSWDRALSQSQANGKNGKVNSLWYKYRYYYRVDSNTLNQNLLAAKSYIDSSSNQYNTSGIYESVDKLKEQFNIDLENGEIISLSDMYVALEGELGVIKATDEGKKKIEIINGLKNNSERYKITKVTFYGNASSQGNNASSQVNENRNNRLAKQRGLTLKAWMNGKLPGIEDAEYEETSDVQKGGDKYDVNDPITKLWRSAYVKIEYEDSNIEYASVAESQKVQRNEQGSTVTDSNGVMLNRLDKLAIKDGKYDNGQYASVKDFLMYSEEGKKIKADYERPQLTVGPDGKPKLESKKLDIWTATMQDIEKFTGENYSDPNAWDYNNAFLNKQNTGGTVERYDNEGEFFELLEKNDPFLHHLITEKIRYFDPAFHSISPEGFNARLTFLHQCTRQGSTVGSSDNLPRTAYNLAFGRPPVCVLRLGDFYYTKIIINSISIQYETPQWDLNPEGIGVMPMFAKVSLNFVFLGGSDLAGPISRLQNAVSFNYYANTSVYDNRAEMVQYDPDGNGHEVKFKPYSYPDMIQTGEPRKEDKETK